MSRSKVSTGFIGLNCSSTASVGQIWRLFTSGVVFSSDPANHSHNLIDAAFGLGDGVTSEMAEVDSYGSGPMLGWLVDRGVMSLVSETSGVSAK